MVRAKIKITLCGGPLVKGRAKIDKFTPLW